VLPDEDPELEGEAKKKYEDEFERLWKGLDAEKNNEVVRARIEQYGATPSRASRDVLIKYATGNKNQEFVGVAYKAIAKIGGKKAIAFLAGKNALRGGDFLLQQSAAEALAETKDARAAAQLLDMLNDKATKSEVMGACAIAAAKAAPTDERVIETLFSLADHKKDTIRAYVMEALGHLKSDRALERLTQALQNDKNTRVRESAAKGMGNSLRPEATPLLEKAAAEDKALTVKSAALESLRKIQAGR
jgi:HEAT repeat protein